MLDAESGAGVEVSGQEGGEGRDGDVRQWESREVGPWWQSITFSRVQSDQMSDHQCDHLDHLCDQEW